MSGTVRSLDLPRLSASEADALTALARRAVKIPVTGWADHGSQPLLTLSLLHESDPLPSLTDARRIGIEWAGARLYADFPMACLETWLTAYLGGERQTLPAAWREASVELACQWLLGTLSRLGRGAAHLLGAAGPQSGPGSVPVGVRQRFLLTLQIDPEAQQVIHGVLYLDGLALLLAASLLRDQPQIDGPVEREALPLVLRFTLGETRLPLAELRRLGRGDVLFFAQSYLAQEGRLQLVLTGSRGQWWTLGVRIEDETLHIESPIRTMTSQNQASESDSMDEQAVDLEHMPVRLTFDIGERVITLGELEKMQPGETIALGRPLKEPVTIRANGAPIGSGVLVDIDGRLGVSVTRLHAPGNPQ
jgi:type III secretion protein Q